MSLNEKKQLFCKQKLFEIHFKLKMRVIVFILFDLVFSFQADQTVDPNCL